MLGYTSSTWESGKKVQKAWEKIKNYGLDGKASKRQRRISQTTIFKCSTFVSHIFFSIFHTNLPSPSLLPYSPHLLSSGEEIFLISFPHIIVTPSSQMGRGRGKRESAVPLGKLFERFSNRIASNDCSSLLRCWYACRELYISSAFEAMQEEESVCYKWIFYGPLR